jgi:hypothetical protein
MERANNFMGFLLARNLSSGSIEELKISNFENPRLFKLVEIFMSLINGNFLIFDLFKRFPNHTRGSKILETQTQRP